ncbi:hypothetical protein K438DRAFT_1970213 [Mycena galopus ATCC 62051]|nr:hypothetical protein K438DRAFT_1970213 [Mycena galopus ATCC 62051]
MEKPSSREDPQRQLISSPLSSPLALRCLATTPTPSCIPSPNAAHSKLPLLRWRARSHARCLAHARSHSPTRIHALARSSSHLRSRSPSHPRSHMLLLTCNPGMRLLLRPRGL